MGRVASFCVFALLCASGCAVVKPHQREHLAHPAMQQPVWTSDQSGDQHMFEVREASAGASGEAGGGCGCN